MCSISTSTLTSSVLAGFALHLSHKRRPLIQCTNSASTLSSLLKQALRTSHKRRPLMPVCSISVTTITSSILAGIPIHPSHKRRLIPVCSISATWGPLLWALLFMLAALGPLSPCDWFAAGILCATDSRIWAVRACFTCMFGPPACCSLCSKRARDASA